MLQFNNIFPMHKALFPCRFRSLCLYCNAIAVMVHLRGVMMLPYMFECLKENIAHIRDIRKYC